MEDLYLIQRLENQLKLILLQILEKDPKDGFYLIQQAMNWAMREDAERIPRAS